MAIKEIKRYNNGLEEFVSEFICDLATDLTTMPKIAQGVAIGSIVLCLENKTRYILSPSDGWEEFE